MSSLHAPSKSVALVSKVCAAQPTRTSRRAFTSADLTKLRDLALVALAFGFVAALTFGLPLPH